MFKFLDSSKLNFRLTGLDWRLVTIYGSWGTLWTIVSKTGRQLLTPSLRRNSEYQGFLVCEAIVSCNCTNEKLILVDITRIPPEQHNCTLLIDMSGPKPLTDRNHNKLVHTRNTSIHLQPSTTVCLLPPYLKKGKFSLFKSALMLSSLVLSCLSLPLFYFLNDPSLLWLLFFLDPTNTRSLTSPTTYWCLSLR